MMKLKSNQTRTYDGDGYKKRAACLCFRSESEEEVRPRLWGGSGPQFVVIGSQMGLPCCVKWLTMGGDYRHNELNNG